MGNIPLLRSRICTEVATWVSGGTLSGLLAIIWIPWAAKIFAFATPRRSGGPGSHAVIKEEALIAPALLGCAPLA